MDSEKKEGSGRWGSEQKDYQKRKDAEVGEGDGAGEGAGEEKARRIHRAGLVSQSVAGWQERRSFAQIIFGKKAEKKFPRIVGLSGAGLREKNTEDSSVRRANSLNLSGTRGRKD